MRTDLYARSLAAFEGRFGHPDGDGPLGRRAVLASDETERLEAGALSFLGALDLQTFHVPAAEGGGLASFEQMLAAAYALSRRDPSLALTVGMLSWLWLVWLAGRQDQKEMARAMLAAGGTPCFAASEAEHGADLLASETVGVRRGGGWEVSGEKWPIGSAGRAAIAFVLARTRAEPGPRSLSWFAVDLDQPAVTRLPRLRTHGLRAADLGGLRLVRATGTLVGQEGEGLELALKIFQITRPLMASIGLGTADTALRVATRFALGRRLYRGRAADLQAVRRALAVAWLQFLAAEVLLISTVRSLHVSPEQMSIASPLTKATAPGLLEETIRAAATVLGARSFLREGETAIFQKMVRDHAATGLIDGSTPVCLQALGTELRAAPGANAADTDRLRRRFRLAEPVPPFRGESLELTARGVDDVMAAAPPEVAAARDGLEKGRPRSAARSSDRLEPPARYGRLHAAACSFHFGRWNEELALSRDGTLAMAGRCAIGGDALEDVDLDGVFERLADRVERDCLLSVVDFPSKAVFQAEASGSDDDQTRTRKLA